MTNNGTILADSIAHVPHLQAFDLIVKKRFSELELDKLLVYLIDTVNADAIPFFAEQFDVLGYKGFRLAQTELDQREIIKKSIELHRFKGTLWAVREALKSIGFGDAVIEEHVEGHWAKFRITLDLGKNPLSELAIADLLKMVDEYKNLRSHLADLSFTLSFDDSTLFSDSFIDGEGSGDIDTVSFGGEFKHNGMFYRNATKNYSKDTDVLSIQII